MNFRECPKCGRRISYLRCPVHGETFWPELQKQELLVEPIEYVDPLTSIEAHRDLQDRLEREETT